MRKLQELLSLDGKVALITGGAGYLGTPMAEMLAEQGATVVVVARNRDLITALSERLEKEYGTRSIGLVADLTKPDEINAAVAETIRQFGRLDILINNAAATRKNSYETITLEDWQYDMDLTLNSVFNTVKAATEELKKTRGVILNIASMYGHVAPDYRLYEGDEGLVNSPGYGAAKGALLQFTRYLASFLSPHGIRVNAISPGPFPTDVTESLYPAFIKRLAAKNMLNRIGNQEDMKGVAALLCSDASAFITGQNFAVDGGWAAW